MTVLLVTYDLKKPGQDYSELLKKLRAYDNVQLSESSYALYTDLSAQSVFDVLRPLIDQNDHIYVIPLTGEAIGYGPKATNKWLSDRDL